MNKRKRNLAICLLLIVLTGSWGCGRNAVDQASQGLQTDEAVTAKSSDEKEKTDRDPVSGKSDDKTEKHELAGLVYQDSEELSYAENFTVDHYEGGYTLLTVIPDEKQYLLVPKNGEIPKDLPEEMTVIRQPVQNIYLVASAVMDLFDALDGLDSIAFSGQKEENWYIDSARQAMAEGRMIYAGKYSKPDYELLVAKGCTLAIENRMILHTPEVLEKLETFQIPAIVECSSYESHPLGRVEWIKFWGALLDKEKEAKQIFEKQNELLNQATSAENTGKTVAFFYITSNGMIQVRQSSDYVPKMIELAGGTYIFKDLGDEDSKRSTVNMQLEDFYDAAKDADYLIYNSAIDGGVTSVEELLKKCGVLKDFKAVKEGNVWCTSQDLYQQTLSIGYLILDIHGMLTGEAEEKMNYLFRCRDTTAK
ncbi:MAG: ABC transporter substrate-binding protein [Lachnospiraceae bacterium]|jgi:iron complex transport system substrate-binding protein|nr:ABC transporter substrate-binding protein [Lachnospiraceae bacterium]